MKTYISLLRGINVSGQKKMSMAGLRELYESLDLADVRTNEKSGRDSNCFVFLLYLVYAAGKFYQYSGVSSRLFALRAAHQRLFLFVSIAFANNNLKRRIFICENIPFI